MEKKALVPQLIADFFRKRSDKPGNEKVNLKKDNLKTISRMSRKELEDYVKSMPPVKV